ncbi:MAG TPA: farnesyl diphosphate synthase [Thiobacillaceae bacterium]|nr:farnesyl diphosphate synthase [Thiobacillaceae bacterium]
MNSEFTAWTNARQARMETVLAEALPDAGHGPKRLHDAMRYAVLGGGKRVRPLLAFAAGEAAGVGADRVERAAAAVELIHAYSLVHDDMPSMDNDVLRRGKPTVHVEFDEASALLVGDALQSLAFEVLAGADSAQDPAIQLYMVRQLARAAGSRGMAGGQAVDLESVGQTLSLPELEFMHILKTGALIRASVQLGALCGRPDSEAKQRALDHYAKCVGLAYQVVDDVLDADSSTATLGKTAGKDAVQMKPTYVSLLGMAPAIALAETLRQDALQALTVFGDEAARLRDLAAYIIQRNH